MSAISSIGSGLNVTGLASGIDTTSIVNGLTALNNQRIAELQSRKDAVSTKQSTMSGLQAVLLDLQSKVGRMAQSVAGAFDGRTAASSDSTVLTAAASTSAQPGVYTLQVQSLAQAEQLASSGVTDS